MVLALSLSPSHLISLCFFCTGARASFALCSSISLNSSKIFSWYFSGAVFCMSFLLTIRRVRTSCLSLGCSTSSLSVRQRLSSSQKALQLFIPSRLTSDEDITFCMCNNLKQFFLFSFLACLAMRTILTLDWRQDLFLQFSYADFRDLAVLQITFSSQTLHKPRSS